MISGNWRSSFSHGPTDLRLFKYLDSDLTWSWPPHQMGSRCVLPYTHGPQRHSYKANKPNKIRSVQTKPEILISIPQTVTVIYKEASGLIESQYENSMRYATFGTNIHGVARSRQGLPLTVLQQNIYCASCH